MFKFNKENIFREKVIKAINLCNEELANRKKGIEGESTIEQLEEVILPELVDLLDRVNNHRYPAKIYRYLLSFANAFKVWGWNMQEPTEIFELLADLNNEYKNL